MAADELRILGFKYELFIYNKATGKLVDYDVQYNRIPQAGIDYLIQAPFGDVAPISNWYCGMFRNNFLPVASTTSADIPSAMGEFVDYSEATRPLWVREYNGLGTMDNAGTRAVFTPTADRLLYGAFIASNPTKGGSTGLLLSVVRFSTAKQVYRGEEAKLVCGITYIPTNVI